MDFLFGPAASTPARRQEGFPQYIQFQDAGTDLGARDADTLNFGAGLTATRGTGVNANKVTVNADAAPGGGVSVAVFSIQGATTGTFNSFHFGDWSPATVVLPNDIATWDNSLKGMDIAEAGTYAVKVECKVQATSFGDPTPFPRDEIIYGSSIDYSVIGSATQLGFNSTSIGLDSRNYVQWVEDFTVRTTDPHSLVQPRIYCKCYNSNEGKDSTFSAVVTITKLS